jgi:para-nitrobenzyl esterase
MRTLAPLSSLFLACAAPHAAVQEGLVRTTAGVVLGVRTAETWAFKGIPYAAAPIGALRWRAPRPAATWDGVRDASGYGYVCMQTPGSTDPRGTPLGSEDCLTLNVWSSLGPHAPRPVFVFVHGGFFTWGASALRIDGVDVYDGATLATQADAVVVTLNYRLGPLGFLAHEKLATEGPTGDYGLQDQLAALRWVQQNIAAFGGDPQHVMLFGQSAGAISTAALVASPRAKGLFFAALLHSGGGNAHPLASAEDEGRTLSGALGCAAASNELECLRSKSAAAIINAGPEDYAPNQYMWGPVVDGDVLPRKPYEMFARGEQNHVPLIVGTTADEFTTMVRHFEKVPLTHDEQFDAAVRARFVKPGLADQVIARYSPAALGGPDAALTTLMSDVGFVCPSDALAASAAKSQHEPVRRFVYAHTYENGPASVRKAGHGLDLPFVFHNLPRAWATMSATEETLSGAMVRYWARFAATGDPNGAGDLEWPTYRADGDTVMTFAAAPVLGHSEPRCRLW